MIYGGHLMHPTQSSLSYTKGTFKRAQVAKQLHL